MQSSKLATRSFSFQQAYQPACTCAVYLESLVAKQKNKQVRAESQGWCGSRLEATASAGLQCSIYSYACSITPGLTHSPGSLAQAGTTADSCLLKGAVAKCYGTEKAFNITHLHPHPLLPTSFNRCKQRWLPWVQQGFNFLRAL